MAKRVALSALLLAMIFVNVYAVNEKAMMMTRMGDRADKMLAQLIPLSAAVPQNNWMYLASPKDPVINYSKYSMPWLMVLSYSDSLFSFYTQRPDIKPFRGTDLECRDSVKIHPGIVFILDTSTGKINRETQQFDSSSH